MGATAQAHQVPEVKWVTAAALAALAENGKTRRGATFTIQQLRQWAPGLVGEKARFATEKLKKLEYIETTKPGHYVITGDGAAAVKAAAEGKVLKSGQHGPKNRPPAPESFAARLWALLRARKVIDSGTAAATLIDVGGDVAAGEIRAQLYLRKWERVGAVAASKRRLADGRKQYVLVQDTPNPPEWELVRQLPGNSKAVCVTQ